VANRMALFRAVDRAFRPERARELAASLTQYYRSPGSSGYLAATEEVRKALEKAHLDSLEVTDHPVYGWEPFQASLRIESPKVVELTDYDSAPSSIAWWSDSTPPEGEQLEVVDVGTGESPQDFEGKGVEGKAVFVHGTLRRPGWWEAAKLAAQFGARGIITDYLLYQTPFVRTPETVPEATQLLRLPYRDKKVWAFSISHSAATKLKGLLGDGPVVVRACVKARSFPSVVRNVLATIQGTELPAESVLLCAHTSGIKPGANCAEGPGMLAELARALGQVIGEGIVPGPRRSIKFLICCEGAGTDAYLEEHPEELENIITTLTYCSTGHRQESTSSALLVYRSPDSVPSFINDYLAELVESSPKEADWIGKQGGAELPLIAFTDHYYTPWSDNTRFAAEGLPAPLFMSWPDRYFHSQFLTEEVIDPAVLRRSALVSGTAALELAAAGAVEAREIAKLVTRRSALRLTRVANRYRSHQDSDTNRALRHMNYVLNRDIAGMKTVSRLAPEHERGGVARLLEQLETGLCDVYTMETGDLKPGVRTGEPAVGAAAAESPAKELAGLVPRKVATNRVRRWAGLTYGDLLEIAAELHRDDPAAGWRSLRVISDEAWNFTDGQRSVQDIADAVGFEFGLVVTALPVYRILQGLEAEGYLEFGTSQGC